MSLYPSLEDMQVDHMMQAERSGHVLPTPNQPLPYPPASAPGLSSAYPGLAEYMGLELTPEEIALNMPEYTPQQSSLVLSNAGLYPVASTQSTVSATGSTQLVAPLSGSSLGLARAQVSHGIRQVVLCKDGDGRVGIKVKAVNKGIFVCLVTKDSPAAVGGLRFGDQILQINGQSVAGLSSDKVHDMLKKAGENNIVLAVRDRPFERTLTLHKDSTGHIGFQFKEGKINSIAVNSSAARNGLLVDHNLLEVNGQNVVGVNNILYIIVS
ncbi:syntenin-1 isoform X2 [Eurytemora carolleeae]|uniref:syntenin-1 isoform X2 n=1 Tax=Eurytemora carolleeae TaxID=1294199 RepID=UPI000C7581C7|nr:syntenin-1 isoform X2 [Eurytemora carolleeae]|eukprot:XP_023321037.1 syntenin-1-like isoform X2 [Eurytemora affinis]